MTLRQTYIRFSQIVLIVGGCVLLLAPTSLFPAYYKPTLMALTALLYVVLIQLPVWVVPASQARERFQAALATGLLMTSLGSLGLWGLYQVGLPYDKIVHCTFSALMMVFGVPLFRVWRGWSLQKSVLVLALVIGVSGIAWEFIEFGFDRWLHFGYFGHLFDLDSFHDIILNILGVGIGATIIFWRRRSMMLIALLMGIALMPHTARAVTILDGDLIKTAVHDNVYIVKVVGTKKFKRLILNPDIFNQYSHLHWENIKTVTEAEFGQYQLSYLVREIEDQAVYRLYPDEDTGTKRWMNLTPAAFEAAGYDWDSIYIMNAHERDAYPTGVPLSDATLPRRTFEYGIIPGISSTADIDTLVNLGVDIVRLVPEDLSFAKRDLQSRGIHMLVQFLDHRGSSPGVLPPANEDAWMAGIAATVRANPDITYWQIWNEPNETLYWYPTPSASAYVRLLKKAYAAIKQANPNAIVISAGLSGVNPPRQYLRDMYAAGARNWFDVLDLHPYRQPQSPDTYLADYLKFMKNIMETNGDLDTPIWITEIGWPTDPNQTGAVSVDQQAQFLRRTYEITRALPFVEKVFWYRLQEAGQGMGILGKPAEAVYREITHL